MWTTILKTITTILPFLLPLFKSKVTAPRNHHFFGEISRLREYVVPSLRFIHKGEYDEGRTLLWRDMLDVLLDVREVEMNVFVEMKKCGGDCMVNCIRNIQGDCEIRWQAKGIPQVIIDKFKQREAKHLETLEFYLREIANKGEFNSEREIKNASLYFIIGVIQRMFSNIGYSVGSINGGLSGHIHKGIECK